MYNTISVARGRRDVLIRAAGMLVEPVARSLGRLPLGVLQRLGAALGSLVWWLQLDWALTTRANLRWCFPEFDDRQRRRLAHASVRANGMLLVEAAHAWWAPAAAIDRSVASVSGLDLVGGAGSTLLLAPHFGNWEILHRWLASRTDLTVMYRPPRSAALHRLLLRARNEQRSRMVPASLAGVRELVRAIRGDGVIGILPDQAPANGGVRASFFGHPALMPSFPARLRPAKVLFAWAERRPDGRFDLHFEAAQLPSGPQAWARECNRAIERIVRRAPEQYQWGYRRFKRQPPGAFRYHL